MNDYEPLDISALCNAGAEVLRQDESPLTGQQSLRGLPFLIGPEQADEGAKNLIALDGSSGSVTVTVGKTARNVIFAHRLQETDRPNGGPRANHVAGRFLGACERRISTPHPHKPSHMPIEQTLLDCLTHQE